MKSLNKLLNYDFADYGHIIINGRYYPDEWSFSGTLSGDTDMGLVITTSYAFTEDRSFMLYKTGANNQGMYQTVDFEYNIYGLEFDIGMWIKVSTQTGDSAVKLSYKWVDSSGSQIGSEHIIATVTSTQNYTLHSVSGVTAPKGTYSILLKVESTGSGQPLLAFADDPYIYGGSDYGLKVYDESGNSSSIIPNVSSIIASGTVSMPDTLQDDDTYGVDIDLPGDDYIDTKNIGVIVQARDFDWELVVNVLPYDTGNKFWGNFFGDDAASYYEKADDGVMKSWSAGAMTPGTPATYNFAVNVDLFAGWDRSATSIKKVRLFAALFYTFLKTVAAGTLTSTFYARDYGATVNGKSGYALTTTQGDVEKIYAATAYDGNIFFHGPKTTFDIYIVHNDGSETTLATGVAEDDRGDSWGGGNGGEGLYSATWALASDTSLVATDSLKFVLNFWVQTVNSALTVFTTTFSITYTTQELKSTLLKAGTWTLYRYVKGYSTGTWGRGTGHFEVHWGTASKNGRFTNIEYSQSASAAQRVCSVGSEGIGEVDYIIYQKDYDGS